MMNKIVQQFLVASQPFDIAPVKIFGQLCTPLLIGLFDSLESYVLDISLCQLYR